jgi:hypothetical protein
MSREVVIKRWCDGVHEQPVEAIVEHRIALDTRKPVVVDLCQACDQAFGLFEDLVRRGVPADKADPLPRPQRVTQARTEGAVRAPGVTRGRPLDTSIERPWPCTDEDCDYPGAIRRSGIGKHMRDMHHMNLAQYDQVLSQRGITVPAGTP